MIFMQCHSSKFDRLVNAFGQVTDSRVLYTTSRFACDCTLAGVAIRPLLNFVFALLRFRICVYVYVPCFPFVMSHFCGSEFWSMDICVKHFAVCALTERKNDPKKVSGTCRKNGETKTVKQFFATKPTSDVGTDEVARQASHDVLYFFCTFACFSELFLLPIEMT